MENNNNMNNDLNTAKMTRRRAFFSVGTKVGIGLFAFIPAAGMLLQSPTASASSLAKNANLAKKSAVTPNYVVCGSTDPNLICSADGNACIVKDQYGKIHSGAEAQCYSGNYFCGTRCNLYN